MAIEYYGYNPPFFGGHQNVLSRQSGDRLIKNDLIQLIMTSVGERVMRPEFGTLLRQSVFNNMDDSDLQNLRSHLEQVIAKYEPRISVNIALTQEDNNLHIQITGHYSGKPNTEFEVEVDIPTNSGDK